MPYQPAVLGSARLNNFRLNYLSAALRAIRETRVWILIDDINVTARVRKDGLTIQDEINDSPNTASFRIEGAAPTVGETVRITLNANTPRLLFNGTLEAVDLTYEGRPTQLVWACSAQDDQARVAAMLPFGAWTNISATTVAQELVATFAPAFTATHVQAGLALVSVAFDGSEGFGGALSQIAKLIGGYFYWEDGDLHLFLEEWTGAPDPIDDTHPFLDAPPITIRRDKSQLRTRVYGRGHGETVITATQFADPILPVTQAASWFSAVGGRAISETQRFTYTGVQAGGPGSIVGPGVTPTVSPTATLTNGTGVDVGVHGYAYTWVTAGGETVPSPLRTVTVSSATIPTPSAAPVPTFVANPSFPASGAIPAGTVIDYAAALSPPSAATGGNLGPTGSITATGAKGTIAVAVTVTSAMVGYNVLVARRDSAGSWYAVQINPAVITASDVGTTITLTDIYRTALEFGGLFATVYVPDPTLRKMNLGGVAVGPGATTKRKIYRTAAGAAQLKLLTTLADNTTTGYLDATADSSLGANAPTSDTSGLSTVVGRVLAGATSILTPSAGPFPTVGGWVVTGAGQYLRYSGITGNTLTGIPTTGIGAIVDSIEYGEHLNPVPALTGVAGLTMALATGAPVNLWVQRDDVAAQAAIAAAESTTARPSTGVYEFLVADERRNEASITALCDAYLTLYREPIVTVQYDTRDPKTKSGKPIVFDLASPLIDDTLTIQSVTITEIDVADRLAPRFHVTASSVKYTLEALLRSLTGLVQD